MKKNEMLSIAGKWMELENIILSEPRLHCSSATPGGEASGLPHRVVRAGKCA
jgi:hypothetical protein